MGQDFNSLDAQRDSGEAYIRSQAGEGWTLLPEKYDDGGYKVVGRWHDNRHTLVTELAEGGAGDEVIMSIAGHVSRAVLSRFSHVRMEAKRRALHEIAARQTAAEERRKDALPDKDIACVRMQLAACSR